MRERNYQTVVGGFTLGALIIMGSLIIAFGGSEAIFMSTYDINVHFPDGVVGVQGGQGVTLNGVRVGQTRRVEFWDPKNVEAGIRVVMWINDEYDIPQGAQVNIGSSIMGFGKPSIMINVKGLDDAAAVPRDGSAVLMGSTTNVLDQLLPPDLQKRLVGSFEGIQTLSEALKPVAHDLDQLLMQRNMQAVDAGEAAANISTLVQRFDLVLKNMNVVMADIENVENLKATLANARAMSERGVVVMDKLDRLGEQGITLASDASAMMRSLRDPIDKLSGVLDELNKAAAAANTTQGTVGLLLNDNRLYEELILATRRMSAALDEVRAAMEVIKREGFKVKL